MSTSVDISVCEGTQISGPPDLGFISDLLGEELRGLEEKISLLLQADNPMINQISGFIWNSGGKRVRPILVFLTSRVCDYFGPKDIDIAAAMEMVHVASLLHDDVIDGAEVRRGNPSANMKWGNHLPILVGDYLYSWASRIMVDTDVPRILRAAADGFMDMIDGEIAETVKKGDTGLTEEGYLQIIKKKTASLFSICARSGAILGGNDGELEENLATYGMNIGITFQLIDDILDYTADVEKLGKPVGIDLEDRKMTLPMIHALRNCTGEEKNSVEEIFSNSEIVSGDLTYCIDLIQKYDSYNYIFELAREYIEQAKVCLKPFKPSVFTDALYQLSDYVIDRNF